MDYDGLAGTIRVRRRELGLTQTELALLAGVDRRTISDLENATGSRGVTVRSMLVIAATLGFDVSLTRRGDD